MKTNLPIQRLLSFGIAIAATFGITSAKDLNPAFATDLYQQLRADEGNVFFSPYSISEAMGMVYVGSGGNTSTEIAKALSFSQDTKSLGPQMQELRRQLMTQINQKDNKLNIANALCVTGKSPLQSYQDTVRQQYDGEIFSGGLEEINGQPPFPLPPTGPSGYPPRWVKKQIPSIHSVIELSTKEKGLR